MLCLGKMNFLLYFILRSLTRPPFQVPLNVSRTAKKTIRSDGLFCAKERLKVVSIKKETQKVHQQIVKNQLNSAFRKGRSSSSPQDEEMAL